MRKRMVALLLVLAIVACAAIGLAACNEGGKNGGGAGDRIFTEDASLAEIISALENAESFTVETKLSYALVASGYYEDGQMNQVSRFGKTAMYSNLTTKYDGGIIREEELYFIEGNESYSVRRSYENGTENETVVKEKNLLSNTDPFSWEWIFIISDLLTEEDGKIVPNPDPRLEVVVTYVRLEGDKLVLGVLIDGTEESEFVFCKVNATDVPVPEELKELAADAEWADYVSYNGVNYLKAEDEYGEYYYADWGLAFDESKIEKTINGLPVRDRY